MAIYDCFTFFNEFDVLEIRLQELADVVDRFVLVEADRTYAGEPKPCYFLERRDEFSAFADKITVVTVDDLPVLENRWVAEVLQRNAIMRGLDDAADDDLVIISDVDEVPRASALAQLGDLADGDVVALMMDFYNYALNLRMPDIHDRARVTRRSTLRYLSPQEVRRTFVKYPSVNQDGKRDSISHAGWHFSCLAHPDELVSTIQAKAHAFAHSEADQPDVLDDARLRKMIASNQLWWDASYGSVPLIPTPVDDSFPRYVVANPERWAPFIIAASDAVPQQARRLARSAARRMRLAGRALRHGH